LGAPGADTVIVPVRCPPVFAVTFILNEPLPVRFVGVIFVTVNQLALLLGIFQVPFAVTLTVVLIDEAPGVHALCDKLKIPPAY
jgi:hypothetical protein